MTFETFIPISFAVIGAIMLPLWIVDLRLAAKELDVQKFTDDEYQAFLKRKGADCE